MSGKSRPLVRKVSEMVTAWEEHAADATFAGMTLPQFKNKVKGSLDARTASQSLKSERGAKRTEIAQADAVTRLACTQVAGAVVGDPEHGPDSPLYAKMGYVTISLRSSGKTN